MMDLKESYRFSASNSGEEPGFELSSKVLASSKERSRKQKLNIFTSKGISTQVDSPILQDGESGGEFIHFLFDRSDICLTRKYI
ncbi:hypothetical protein V6N13_092518 [Hibiscus sabdariffa]|uniref:Uncharacterized protein n=1 Tax=Hibiscus sabdariffa TaxID=183260 RepID=A0ABR2CCK3_9ROSI